MVQLTTDPRRAATVAATLLALALAAVADTTVSTIPLAPHGDGGRGSTFQPGALSPTAFLASAEGADGDRETADDVTLLVTGLDASPTVLALDTPHLSSWSGRPCVLSATSALVYAGGPDGDWGTADDVVHLLRRLGSTNEVTTIAVGALDSYAGSAPTRLSATTAVLCGLGPDRSDNSADDRVVVITDIGGANRVVGVDAPYLQMYYVSRPIPLSPTSFLVGSWGPDGDSSTDDDLTYLFTIEGDTVTRTDIATPRLIDGAPGRATRVSATRAVVASEGPDATDSSADDSIYLIDDLGGTDTVTEITVGPLFTYSASHAVALSDDLIVLCSRGPDGRGRTGDEGLVVISGLGTTNTVELVTLGTIDEDRQCRPLRLSSSSCAVVTGGPDGSFGEADDELAIVTDVGGANVVRRVTVPGLADGSTSTPVAAGSSEVLVRCGGADGQIGGADDAVAFVSGLTGTPAVELIPTGPAPYRNSNSAQVPVLLGDGRAVFLIAGSDGELGQGGDDALRVVHGLPQPRSLLVQKLGIKFKEAKPQKGARFSVKAAISLDAPDLFASDDVTISIGNAAQTIPAAAFKANRKGTSFKYADKKRRAGFLSKVVVDLRRGKLTIAGKGVETDGETTSPGYVPVVLEWAEVRLAAAVSGTAKKAGIQYKAPRR